MSDSIKPDTPEEPELPESHDEENESDEEEEEEEFNFVVEEILSARVTTSRGRKQLEFETRWQSDTSITWEPLQSFPNDLEHEEIVRFKTNHPDKYKVVEKFLADKEKKKPKSHKHWHYVEVSEEAEESRYEKCDSVAGSREVKALYDPNRLEDKDEAYLKSLDSRMRVSRNSAKQIRGGGDDSKASESPTPQPKEQKKRAPGGGRKKNTVEKAASSSSKSPVETMQKKRRGQNKKNEKKSPTPPGKHSSAANSMASLADGIETWTPRRRAVKLNSSDSDSDFEPEKAPPKKRRSAERVKPDSSDSDWDFKPEKAPPKKKRSTERVKTDSSDSESDFMPQKAPPKKRRSAERSLRSSQSPKPTTSAHEVKKNRETLKRSFPDSPPPKREDNDESSAVSGSEFTREDDPVSTNDTERLAVGSDETSTRDPDVYYADEDEENYDDDPEVVQYGLQLFRGNVDQLFEQQKDEFKLQQQIPLLAEAIVRYDLVSTECILENITQADAEKIVAKVKFPLHIMMQKLYTEIADFERSKKDEQDENRRMHLERKKMQCEQMVRLVLHYMPVDVLRSQYGHENTLLHYAINVKSMSLTRFLLNIGSPVDIRNEMALTAVESANLSKNPKFLDMILKKGGTFHYMLEDIPVCFPYENDRRWLGQLHADFKEPLMRTAMSVYNMVDNFCRSQRSAMLPPSIIPIDFGPILFCPRGKQINGIPHSVRFRFPVTDALYDTNSEFIFSVIPMKFDHVEQIFYGKSSAPIMKEPPLLNNIACAPLSPRLPYYNCTNSVHAQVNNPIIWSRNEENRQPVPVSLANDFKSVFTLDLLVDPSEIYDFMACQVMRIESQSGGNSDQPYSPSVQFALNPTGPLDNRKPDSPNMPPTNSRFQPANQQRRSDFNQPSTSSNPTNIFNPPHLSDNRPGPSNFLNPPSNRPASSNHLSGAPPTPR